LLRYAIKLTNDYAWSQDLVQESFIKLWKHKGKVDNSYAQAFLYKVLYNKMIDDQRKKSRVSLFALVPERSGTGDNLEHKDLIEKAFDLLTVAQKQIIMLRDWEGYSYQEIGQILDIKINLVKVQLFRARKKMKASITSINKDFSSCYENK